MELLVIPKGNKFTVSDKKSRLLYTIKKKAFGGKYILLDASNYELYTFSEISSGKKPAFEILLNDSKFMNVRCLSLFLDPSIEFENNKTKFILKSKDRKNFIIVNSSNEEIGSLEAVTNVSGEIQYEIVIDNKYFDDYIPFFALAVERAFGDMNKSK